MKKLKKINVKLYKKYYLTKDRFYYLWDNDIIKLKDLGDEFVIDEDYLYVKILKGTNFAYTFTIRGDEVNYHGIVNLFVVDLLTSEHLQTVEYPDKLNKINKTFGETLTEAYTNNYYIF